MSRTSTPQWYLLYDPSRSAFVFACLSLHPALACAHRALCDPSESDATLWRPSDPMDARYAVYSPGPALIAGAPGSLSSEALPFLTPEHPDLDFVDYYGFDASAHADGYALPSHILENGSSPLAPFDPYDPELSLKHITGNGLLTPLEEQRLSDLMAVDYDLPSDPPPRDPRARY